MTLFLLVTLLVTRIVYNVGQFDYSIISVFNLTLLCEQCNNILTVHVGLTDNDINNMLSLVSAS